MNGRPPARAVSRTAPVDSGSRSPTAVLVSGQGSLPQSSDCRSGLHVLHRQICARPLTSASHRLGLALAGYESCDRRDQIQIRQLPGGGSDVWHRHNIGVRFSTSSAPQRRAIRGAHTPAGPRDRQRVATAIVVLEQASPSTGSPRVQPTS
jgi:hypothetical protein